MTNIDALLKGGTLNIQTRVTRYDINFTECWATKWLDDNIETDEVIETDDSKTYDQIVSALSPRNYWRLGEATTASAMADIGSGAQTGTYLATTPVNQTGLLTADANKSARFGSSALYQGKKTNFAFPVNGTYYGNPTEATLECMFKLESAFTGYQYIMGQWVGTGGFFGQIRKSFFAIRLYTDGGKYYLDYGSIPGSITKPNTAICEVKVGETYHMAFVLRSGIRSIYKNGALISATTTNDYQCPETVDNTKTFYIGYNQDIDATIITGTFILDEVAIYTTALAATELRRHYIKSKDGYKDPLTGIALPPISSCDDRTLPYLGTGTDVTEYILMESLNLGRGEQNLVDVLEFSCDEKWGFETLNTVFQANTYLIVERRYTNPNVTYDSGWENLGHFLVEGPAGKEVRSDGSKTYRVSAKGMMKLLELDIPNRAILRPDLVHVTRRDMVDVSTGVDVKTFRIARIGTTNEYYENVSDFPTPKIWAKNFPGGAGDIVAPADVVRARGAEESVQFLYGNGAFRIDYDYFNTQVKNKGLGIPGTIQIEAYRYLTSRDVFNSLTITAIQKTTVGPDITYASVKIAATDLIEVTEEYAGRTIIMRSGSACGYLYTVVGFNNLGATYEFVLKNYTSAVLPDLASDGVVIGDTFQLGDANLIQDLLHKVFLMGGFQNQDSTKPFYFSFVAPAFDGGISIPPLRYFLSDNKTWLSIVTDILSYAPGNYKMYQDNNGAIRTVNVVQSALGTYDHELCAVMDSSMDGTDYGIYTRIVSHGRFIDAVDVGLNVANGGFATYGAYKLDNFYTIGDTDGVTLGQAAADAIIAQIANNDPKSPANAEGGFPMYGAIWRKYGTTYGTRWAMEDSDLFWIDLGKNLTSTKQYLIDEIELQTFPVFAAVGTKVDQTMLLYYMTEDDYISATGDVPPTASGDATVATNMNALATSPYWKPLISETTTQEGITTITSKDFVDGQPLRLRFIKVQVGQPFHHPDEPNTLYAGVPVTTIALAGLRIYTSPDIIQIAELGKTPPFDTTTFRNLAKRLRRRTVNLEYNPYITDTKKAKDFALQELQERYTEFTPITLNAIAPNVDIWNTVYWINPETGVGANYLVHGVTIMDNGMTNLHVVDYTIYN